MKIGYLINQYPKVSHSFIRREILALERQGVSVLRTAIRGWDAEAPDAEDRLERERTAYVLQRGAKGLFGAALRVLISRPRKFANAVRLVFRLADGSDRPLPIHFIYLAEACFVAEWCTDQGVEHVHAHFGTNAAEVALLVRLLGGPGFSFTVHGPDEFDKPESLHLEEKIRHSAFVVAISSYGRSQLYRWAAHDDWQKIQVVHCGLEPALLTRPIADVTDLARLVCVGRLSAQKGQLLLIDAVARLIESGRALHLVLAGDGEMREVIEGDLETRGLREHVTITGWIDAEGVRDQLDGAQALVLASFAEGLPVVIMEAMAAGRPVLSTDVAGIPELVRHGQDGLLFAAGDVDALVEAIDALLQMPVERRLQMGHAGKARVTERHAVDVEAGKLVSLFHAAIAAQAAA